MKTIIAMLSALAAVLLLMAAAFLIGIGYDRLMAWLQGLI